MSRMAKKPIPIPQQVKVELKDRMIKVKGPLGELAENIHPEINVRQENGSIIVEKTNDRKLCRCLHGTTASLIRNMIEGVVKGYEKSLVIEGVGYRAKMEKGKLSLNIGFSHPVVVEVPEGINIDVPKPTVINIKGIDKQKVGQIAAVIRRIRPPDPYKGKGIRYIDEYVKKKAGKRGV